MGWQDYFAHGLNAAMAIGGAALIPANPALGAGLALQGISSEAQMLGTHRSMTGVSDQQIGQYETAARSAGGAQIQRREKAAGRRVGAQAAQGRTLASGLAMRDFGDVAASGQADQQALEADILRTKAQMVNARQYGMSLDKLGVAGRTAGALAAPLTQLGSAILAKRYGLGGAPQQQPDLTGGTGPDLATDYSANYGDVRGSSGYTGRLDPNVNYSRAPGWGRNARTGTY